MAGSATLIAEARNGVRKEAIVATRSASRWSERGATAGSFGGGGAKGAAALMGYIRSSAPQFATTFGILCRTQATICQSGSWHRATEIGVTSQRFFQCQIYDDR
jgi:hypothetical protein